jgi:hypothetical protein
LASASITGPTSVTARAGSPIQGVHRALQALDDVVGGVFGQEQQAQGRAALAGAAEGRQDHVVDHLLALGGGVDEHAVQPAGLGDERHDRALALGQRLVDPPGGVGAAGEGHAVQALVGGQGRADRLAATRQQGQQAVVQAGGVIELHGLDRRSAGSARPAWPAPRCRPPGRRRSGR